MTRITTVGVITLVAAVSAAAIYKAKVRNDHQVDLAPSPIMMEQILNNKPNFAVIDSEADKKKPFSSTSPQISLERTTRFLKIVRIY